MLVREFLEEVKGLYSEYFNGSLCEAVLYRGLGKAICINCYLGEGKTEFSNGYKENDMIHVNFWIHNLQNDIELEDELPSDLLLENKSKSFLVKPDNQYMCYGSKSISYRKVKGNHDKLLKTLDTFFNRLSTEIKEAYNNNETCEKFNGLIEKRVR